MSIDATPQIIDLHGRVGGELLKQLEVTPLSDHDLEAVNTALVDALCAGYRLGIAHSEQHWRRQLHGAPGFGHLRVTNEVIDPDDPEGVESDLWDERYGNQDNNG